MTIPLVPALLTGSSNLPGDRRRAACSRTCARGVSLFGLAPCGVLPATTVTSRAVRSYRTFSPLPTSALRPSGYGLRRGRPTVSAGLPRRSSRLEEPRAKAGGIFSVPLSVGSPRPGITRRTALWSSDFPLPRAFRIASAPKSDGGRLRTAAVIRSTATDKYRMVTRGVLCADAGWPERIAARPLCGLPGAVEVSRRTCFARGRDTGIR
jgi:hypothetical protein